MPVEQFGDSGLSNFDDFNLTFNQDPWEQDPFDFFNFQEEEEQPEPEEEQPEEEEPETLPPIGEQDEEGFLWLGCGNGESLIIWTDPNDPSQGGATCIPDPGPGPGDEG